MSILTGGTKKIRRVGNFTWNWSGFNSTAGNWIPTIGQDVSENISVTIYSLGNSVSANVVRWDNKTGTVLYAEQFRGDHSAVRSFRDSRYFTAMVKINQFLTPSVELPNLTFSDSMKGKSNERI